MMNVEERWEQGVDHDPRSEALFHAIAKIDRDLGGDAFWFTWGGDGDNGEHLMYLLDIYFEGQDNVSS
jgi:hypothetical protein